jgi:hypothetical protein
MWAAYHWCQRQGHKALLAAVFGFMGLVIATSWWW